MFEKIKQSPSQESTTFQRFSRLYLMALSIIALTIIGSQVLVQRHLIDQLSDARVVNIAGRQRMLSQRITKELLLLNNTSDSLVSHEVIQSIKENFDQWNQAHRGLQLGDPELDIPATKSPTIKQQFQDLNPIFNAIASQIKLCLKSGDSSERTKLSIQPVLNNVLVQEQEYLIQMDEIVNQLSKEALAKVEGLQQKEYFLLILGLGIIIAEILLLFRPAAKRIRATIRALESAREKAIHLVNRTETLYKEREQSIQELQALNFAVDQAMLFASANIDGSVIHLSKKFCDLLGLQIGQVKGQLAELMSSKEGDQEYIKTVIRRSRSSIWNGEVHVTTYKNEERWLELSIVPVNRRGVMEDLLILAADVTDRKKAQKEIDQLKEARFEEAILQQKLRSSAVVEAQEEERKRIARDMHDGIGQMLTALKFNIQAVNIEKPKKAKNQLVKVNELAAGVIQGVRVATFNLTPPELNDYGIGPALSKLASELSKLTNQAILFENKTEFNARLDSIVETNLYRITQEAVNNAIKYAQASYILITLSHSKDLLSIVIDDNGSGFSEKDIKEKNFEDGSGMGLAFMKERINFINGRLFIRSMERGGTRVTLNVPF